MKIKTDEYGDVTLLEAPAASVVLKRVFGRFYELHILASGKGNSHRVLIRIDSSKIVDAIVEKEEIDNQPVAPE